MSSIRARLLIALILLTAFVSLLAATVTYRRVLHETSSLFDYQLRQMALSLRSQISLAPRVEVPPDENDTDFVIQIWDLFGTRVYLSRPGLPLINQTVIGYADLAVQGRAWRAYGLQTVDGVIQIAQPIQVRERLARAAALRVVIPLMLALPIMIVFVAWIVRRELLPLREVIVEVQRRDARTLAPLTARTLPQEIEPLVSELNRLLARLQTAFAGQRAFIADAAHELRSPLTALNLQLQLLDRAPDDAARRAARDSLGAAVERAIHLVEQLLSLARNEPAEIAASFDPVDLAAIAAQALTDALPLADSKCIELSLDNAGAVPVRGDREALRTLARNLIDNAVRYTPAGGSVRVRVRCAFARALLEVIDTGPGIAVDDRNRVFDRFYRRAGTSETGTGLGLAIVKAIAVRHGADVTLEDAPSGGLHAVASFPLTS